MKNRVSVGEYLAFLSVKYEVDADDFYHALVSAQQNQKSECGSLCIDLRFRTQDRSIFLIRKNFEGVVAQLPISNDFLQRQRNPIKDFMESDMVRGLKKSKDRAMRSLSIRDLRVGMNHVSLRAKVLEIPCSKRVFTRFGDYASVAHVLIADETGTIRLCLWNEQINSVSTGDTIQLENVRASAFRGEAQLSIGRIGTLSSVGDPNLSSKETNDHQTSALGE